MSRLSAGGIDSSEGNDILFPLIGLLDDPEPNIGSRTRLENLDSFERNNRLC